MPDTALLHVENLTASVEEKTIRNTIPIAGISTFLINIKLTRVGIDSYIN